MHSPLLQNSQGFTLIEVIIAITVLSFISYSTYQMIDSNTSTKDRVITEDRQVVQTLTTIGRLESDISQIYNPLFSSAKPAPTADPSNPYSDDSSSNANSSFDGKTKTGGLIPQFKSEDKSSIIFFTQANRRKIADTKESRFAWVKYSLQPMEADPDEPEKKSTGQYAMVRQMIPTDIYSGTIDWTKIRPQIILENVKNLEFLFWNEKTKKFTESLQELNENKNLIRSIQVKITWVNSDNNEQKIMKIFRVLNPYFNTKQDDLKTGGAFGDSTAPPGVPDLEEEVVQ